MLLCLVNLCRLCVLLKKYLCPNHPTIEELWFRFSDGRYCFGTAVSVFCHSCRSFCLRWPLISRINRHRAFDLQTNLFFIDELVPPTLLTGTTIPLGFCLSTNISVASPFRHFCSRLLSCSLLSSWRVLDSTKLGNVAFPGWDALRSTFWNI